MQLVLFLDLPKSKKGILCWDKNIRQNNSLVFSCKTSWNVSKELLPRNILISLKGAFWRLYEFQIKYLLNFIVFSL